MLGWLASGGLAAWLAGLAGLCCIVLCWAWLGPPAVFMPAGEGLCALHVPVGARWRKPGSPLENIPLAKRQLSGRLCWAVLCRAVLAVLGFAGLALGCVVLAGAGEVACSPTGGCAVLGWARLYWQGWVCCAVFGRAGLC